MIWSGCAWNWTGARGGTARQSAADTTAAWAALEQAVIGKAVDLLSGPGGLASFLRRRQLGARLGGPSLPLDIGYSENDPGGHPQRGAAAGPALPVGRAAATSPPAACQVHHTKHKADGGKTSVKDCVLAVLVPPPDRDPPLGLDPGREPGRDDHARGTRTRPRPCTATDPRSGRGDPRPTGGGVRSAGCGSASCGGRSAPGWPEGSGAGEPGRGRPHGPARRRAGWRGR